ncbi:MAG TPA: hypothetical protein VF691_16065 [Cytophagaceae bacterium]|jgi:hypothetical protein
MKRLKSIFLFASIILLANCQSRTTENFTKSTISSVTENLKSPKEGVDTIIDIKKITGKTLAAVEKLLGKAESKEKVKGYPCKDVDCQRAYFKKGTYEIIFKKSKADRITINNIPNLTSNDDAVQALGLPPKLVLVCNED